MEHTKKCNKCNVIQNITEFSPHPTTKDGHSSHCKACQRIRVAKLATSRQGVYAWRDDKGDYLWIGSSKRLDDRLWKHKTWLKNPDVANPTAKHLYPKLLTHDGLYIDILEECPEYMLKERERYYMDIHKPLYNINRVLV